VHIDALDSAAALAGIVGRAVHQRIDRRIEIRVFHDVAWILAAELQAKPGKRTRRSALHRATAFDRTGEVDEIEATSSNQGRGSLVIEEHVLEDILGNAGLDEGLHQPLADQERLRGMFQNNRIARHERRGDRVNRRHVGVVPGRHDEDDAMRLALDPALELVTLFDDKRRQRIGSDRGDIVGALVEALVFAAITDRAAHLPGKLGHDDVGHFIEPCDALQHQLNTVFQRALCPGLLRLARTRNGLFRRLQRKRRALGVNRSVDR